MAITKTLGGDRLGSGKKNKVQLHGYERSTHDMGYLWRSTMSAGTLVPFLSEVALPGDTFDINLDIDVKTHPTVGPLFGSYKIQLDILQAPIRLYQGQLHNNKLGIGMNMANIKLPQMSLQVINGSIINPTDPDNSQINPSCILSYLGIRGVGNINSNEDNPVTRQFNALPLLSYWDIYKNYYANKQEEIGYVIHQNTPVLVETIDSIGINNDGTVNTIEEAPLTTSLYTSTAAYVEINYTGASPLPYQIIINTSRASYPADQVLTNIVDNNAGLITAQWNIGKTGNVTIYNWRYITENELPTFPPTPTEFNLGEIDEMREALLSDFTNTPVDITTIGLAPYSMLLDWSSFASPYLNNQEGLGLKTYQSDLFNNWLSTEWIDGSGGINEITAIDTSGGSFSIDTLNLSKKVYEMLNRIAVSGGSYDDWLDAVYTHDRYVRAETPIYHGGLIRELVFQEVISNSESSSEDNPTQPLGTLAGRGIMAQKKKGGYVTIKIDEPSYLIGIVSLTPRIDYSQGNKWDTHLQTMDDFHKPALDEIGFQELITEQMAWWTTKKELAQDVWTQKSAGKQPAWINYMTNVNQVRGNFAIPDNEMFMILNRRYEWDENSEDIADLTTYIDPSKFNNIFADSSIDAQNFWVQIACDITARRKMSAKIMPNL
ncbi:MAG: major capsid protein [Microviridae sp.]|nr:MAG: major capsid protein [Microviridae sp.]